jgi:hypothetical protein
VATANSPTRIVTWSRLSRQVALKKSATHCTTRYHAEDKQQEALGKDALVIDMGVQEWISHIC